MKKNLLKKMSNLVVMGSCCSFFTYLQPILLKEDLTTLPLDIVHAMRIHNKNFFHDPGFTFVRELLDKNFVSLSVQEGALRIPKIIHQIWLGGSLPEKYKAFQASWIKMHPDWQYILWTEKEIDQLGLVNRKQYDQTPNYGAKSDIARYEILYRFGGLYIDTDFECLKPFYRLHCMYDFYVCCIDDDRFAVSNGIIGSRPGHPILKKCLDNLKEKNVSCCTCESIMANTGPYFFTNCILETVPHSVEKNIIFPSTVFFPFPHLCRFTHESFSEIKTKWVKEESFAIHWWECSWQKNNCKRAFR